MFEILPVNVAADDLDVPVHEYVRVCWGVSLVIKSPPRIRIDIIIIRLAFRQYSVDATPI